MMLRALTCATLTAALVAPPTKRHTTRLQATVAEATGGANAKSIDELAARTKDARSLAGDLIPCGDDADLKAWLARFIKDGDVDAAEAKVGIPRPSEIQSRHGLGLRFQLWALGFGPYSATPSSPEWCF